MDLEKKTWQDTVYLIGCALHGLRPKQSIESDLADLYTFCEFHSVTAMAAVALEMLWKGEPPRDAEWSCKFQQALARSVRKAILLNAEREQILQHLEKIGCWYMPLKGSILQYDYPKFGIRQMSDNDILINASRQEEVHEFLCQRGYEAVSYQMTVENNYHKAPVYNYEMHTALFGAESSEVFRSYYADVKERLVPDEGKQFGYHFTPEDFYIYMIAHAWKHAQRGGIGIRFLADIWVWNQKHGAQVDWTYVSAELQKLGAAEFEAETRQLSAKLLNTPTHCENISERELETLEQFLTAGTYGTSEQKLNNRMKNVTGVSSKFRYVFSRVFPSAQELSLVHPHVREQKWRVPLIWIWRLIRAIFLCPADTVKEIVKLVKK